MHHKRGGRAGAHALRRGPYGGAGGRDPSREPVRQLLTGLSHPAREKDHLARKADISNDTAARLFGLPLSSLSLSFSPSRSFPSGSNWAPGPRSFPVVALSTRACTTRGRSPSSPRKGLRERVSVIARVSPLLLILLAAVLFLRKAPPACTVTF